jgi:hypothetical protein
MTMIQMNAGEERAARDRIAKLWRALVERDGREDARFNFSLATGCNSPNQLREEDLEKAERLLTVALKPTPEPQSKAEVKLPEGNAPEGFAKGIRARWNAPRERNPITGEITIIHPEPDNGDAPHTETLRNPHEPVETSPCDPAEIEEEAEPVGTFNNRRPVNTAGKTVENLKGDLADEIWERHRQRERERQKHTTK